MSKYSSEAGVFPSTAQMLSFAVLDSLLADVCVVSARELEGCEWKTLMVFGLVWKPCHWRRVPVMLSHIHTYALHV